MPFVPWPDRDLAFDAVGGRLLALRHRHAVARQLRLEARVSDTLPSPGAPVTLGTTAVSAPPLSMLPVVPRAARRALAT